jgi:hypothetical protein
MVCTIYCSNTLLPAKKKLWIGISFISEISEMSESHKSFTLSKLVWQQCSRSVALRYSRILDGILDSGTNYKIAKLGFFNIFSESLQSNGSRGHLNRSQLSSSKSVSTHHSWFIVVPNKAWFYLYHIRSGPIYTLRANIYAQGQSFELCGFDLNTDCFSHGQWYVASSRVGNPDTLYLCTENGTTNNIVYPHALWN